MVPKKSVLIVDDDPDIHALLRAALEPRGLAVESASSGEDALRQSEFEYYDVILIDILMPGMNGLTLLHKLHETRPSVKAIVMTDANTPSNIVAAIREHAFSYFSKPFSTEGIADAVLRAIETPDGEDDIDVVSARPDWIALNVRCRIEVADRLVHFFREMNMGLSPDQQEHVVTAFRELLMNSIEHGCHLNPDQKVHLTYIRTPRAIIYYIRDPGDGFSMENLPHAAISNLPESPVGHIEVRTLLGIRPGGFGILLTRQLVDDVIYNEKGNEVLLIKYLKDGAGRG